MQVFLHSSYEEAFAMESRQWLSQFGRESDRTPFTKCSYRSANTTGFCDIVSKRSGTVYEY